ncbi:MULTISPECIES: hypothetical protein [unclassified Bradyrhizobium]|nr:MULTISPECIES: hypothetical protein [unclassified Bradyrhizobium]MCK1712096.1 hypothetical protein [Bradyrhizobium sp. 143]MCK1732072.1 hypothetical protein [Bradyrhizobium sp. 142]
MAASAAHMSCGSKQECQRGRDQEFYLEAERQLKEELIRHELKTPDTL